MLLELKYKEVNNLKNPISQKCNVLKNKVTECLFYCNGKVFSL